MLTRRWIDLQDKNNIASKKHPNVKIWKDE